MEHQEYKNIPSSEERIPDPSQKAEVMPAEASGLEMAQRVHDAFMDAQGEAGRCDPEAAEAEALRGMDGYGKKLGASEDIVRSVNEVTGAEGALADIRQQEGGTLDRFRQKLRKLSGPIAACMALSGAAHAEEMSGVSATGEAEASVVSEGQQAMGGQEHQQQKAISREDGQKETVGREGTDLPEKALPANEEAIERSKLDEKIRKKEEGLASEEEQRRIAAEGRKDEDEKRFEKEFRERDFSNEGEILRSLHEAALNHEKEFITVYTVSNGDRVEVILGGFAGKEGGMVTNTQERMRSLRQEGKKIMMAHTHPTALAEKISAESSIDGGFRAMPPSLPDVRTASDMDWLDRYDDAGNRSEADKMVNASESIVVDHDGVWRYRADFFHPYFQEQRKAAIDEATTTHILTETDEDNAEKVRDFYSHIVVPDEIILNRIVPAAREKLREDLASAVRAKEVGTVSPITNEYEYTDEQFKVGQAVSPEEKAAAVESFIKYCKGRGIEISFTPFDAKGE